MPGRWRVSLVLAVMLLAAVPAAQAADLYFLTFELRGSELLISPAAAEVAAESARRQAREGRLFHADLRPLLDSCNRAGEVVGRGPDVQRIFKAWRESPDHWDIISSSAWTSMGAGQAKGADGNIYLALVFCAEPVSFPSPVVRSGSLPQGDGIGYHDPRSGMWRLVEGGEVRSFYYGDPADIALACDWDGDGTSTVGLYRPRTGFLHLRNSNTQGFSDVAIFYGVPRDLPVCGDWDGDGVESIGIYRPSEQRFYLRNRNTQGFADLSFVFGNRGDIPFAGDWDGDGVATVGVYRPSTGQVMVTNRHGGGVASYSGYYGMPGDRFVVGDWDGDGRDSFGIFRPSQATFYLSNRLGQATADIVISFGDREARPVAGGW